MNDTEKKLDALIGALGFDIEGQPVSYKAECGGLIIDAWELEYKLTKREACVPLSVQSKEWGCIVDFVLSHREDIINDVNDYGGLGFILDFMERHSDE